MMKNIRQAMLFMFVLLFGTNAVAQSGIRVYKNDGSTMDILYSDLDSIVGVPCEESDVPVISLGGHAGNENGENKDSYIMFSISCLSRDASYVEMFVTGKAEIDNLTDKGVSLLQIADANMGNGVILGNDEIDKVNKSVYWLSMDNTDGVIANTEYTCIALVTNIDGKSNAVRYDVATEAADDDTTPPTVHVEGRAGDADGNLKSEAVTFTVSCKSKNASYAEAFVAETSFVNDILQGTTLEDLMKYNAGIGKVFDKESLEKLNNSSISLTWDQLLSGTEYSLLFCVKTKGGGMTVERCDVTTASAATGVHGNYNANTNGWLSGGNKGMIITDIKSPL